MGFTETTKKGASRGGKCGMAGKKKEVFQSVKRKKGGFAVVVDARSRKTEAYSPGVT